MEQLSPNVGFIGQSFLKQSNNSIRLNRQSRISQGKSLNEVVFIIEYEKAMEQIEMQPEKCREGIELLRPLLEKCSTIKNSKAKIYYMKENILISLVKLLNKQGDQLQIINIFNEYMPDMIKQAKIFQAKKGNIIIMVILWAKCYYASERFIQALELLQKATSLLQIFETSKLTNQLKISFLKAKIFQQQRRINDYQNQISSAYQLVKSNNILSTLGLKITQIYHNIKLADDANRQIRRDHMNRSYNRERDKKTSIIIKPRTSLQAPTIQSRFQENKKSDSASKTSNSNVIHNLSMDKQRAKARSDSKNSKTSKASRKQSSNSNFIQMFTEMKSAINPRQKRSTFILQSQINSNLLQIASYKHTSQMQSNNHILKRPQYKKYSLCYKSFEKPQDKPNTQIIHQQSKDLRIEQSHIDSEDFENIANKQNQKEKNSRRTSRAPPVEQSILDDDESQQQPALDIIPLTFPTEFVQQQIQQSFEQTLPFKIEYTLNFLESNRCLAIKSINVSFNSQFNFLLSIQYYNNPQVVLVSIQNKLQKSITKQSFYSFLQDIFHINIIQQQKQVLTIDQKIKKLLKILACKHIAWTIKQPIGKFYSIQKKEIVPVLRKKIQNKDRVRFTRRGKSAIFRRIISEEQILGKKYIDISESANYQKNSEIRMKTPLSQDKILNQYQVQCNTEMYVSQNCIQSLIIKPEIVNENIQYDIFTGKYTFNSQTTLQISQNINTNFSSSIQIINRLFKQDQECIRQFYDMMKYNLIMQDSKQWMKQYFKEITVSILYFIQGIGSCKIQLTAFLALDIYEKQYVFLRFEVVPSSTKTRKIKFVITKEDIQNFLGTIINVDLTKKQLFVILKKLKQKFIYIKDSLYYSLVLESHQNYGYNKFIFYQYQHVANPRYFLSNRLKSVRIFVQKTIRIQLQNKKTFSVVTVEQLHGIDSLKVLLYVPSTNRKFEFSLPLRVLEEINASQKSLQQTDWNSVLSTMKFNTIQGGILIVNIGSYSALVTQSHFTCFGKVNKYVFHVCFKVVSKKETCSNNFLSQFQNIIMNQLTDYDVYFQLHWLKRGRKLCYVLSIIDFIELILNLPRKIKIHKELQCMFFNLADISLMLSIGYEQIVASLMKFSQAELEQLITNKAKKYQLQRTIQHSLRKSSSNHLLQIIRPLKTSLNSKKQICRQNHLSIIHKGIFKFKDKNLIGIFSNPLEKKLVIRMYNKEHQKSQSQIKVQDLSIPFVGDQKQNILNSCNNRILKMIRNKLLLSRKKNCNMNNEFNFQRVN